jgi:hypothetical protein
MKTVLLKYLSLLFGIFFVFTQMIACGEQMYQADMKQDHDQAAIPATARNPQSALYGIHASGGWMQIPIRFKWDSELNEQQKTGLKKAMETWELAVGKRLFLYDGFANESGDDFSDLHSSLDDRVNGQYIDRFWDKTGKGTEVLATTIWLKSSRDSNRIETADIRFNLENYTIGDTLDFAMEVNNGQIAVDMETLALHELGHLLGLSHDEKAIDPYSVMLQKVFIGFGMTNRRLSLGDIQRIQSIYGCEGAACDLDGIYAFLEKRAREQSGQESSKQMASE